MGKFDLGALFGGDDDDGEPIGVIGGDDDGDETPMADNPIDDEAPVKRAEPDPDATVIDNQDSEEEEAAKKAAAKKAAAKKAAQEAEQKALAEAAAEEEAERLALEEAAALELAKKKEAAKKAAAKKAAEEAALAAEEEEEETALTVKGQAEPPATKGDLESAFDGGTLLAAWGTKVARFPINKFKCSVGPKRRIAIPMLEYKGKPMLLVTKVHYSDETGRFYCFGGDCCVHMGLPDVRYNFPILVYDTNVKGKLVSADFEIEFLQCAESRYEEFLTYLNEGVDITTLDFIVTCEDDTYQKLKFAAFPNATYLRDPEFAKAVCEKLVKAWAFAPQVIANKMDRARMLEKLGAANKGESVEDEEEFDLKSFLKKGK